MKPQELRIGNYVRKKGTDNIYRISAIDALNRMIGLYMYITNKDNYKCPFGYSIDEIEPVPIREVYNSLPAITELTWADKALCEYLYYYRDILLTNLHELQNIHYALTGNEIEIEI